MDGFRHENKYFISWAGYQFLRGRLAAMLDELRQEDSYSEQDAMLVLKDILYTVWKSRKS